MENEKPGYFAVIPAVVRYDKNLKQGEKLLYGEITALSNKEGYCYAKNNYFADLYDVSTRTITEWISNLAKQGHLEIEMVYKEGSKEVAYRKLLPLWKKTSIPLEENFYTPLEENFQDNNINNIIIHNNNNILDNNNNNLNLSDEEKLYFKDLSENTIRMLTRKRYNNGTMG